MKPRFISLLFLCLTLALATAHPQAPSTYDTLIKQGNAQLQSGSPAQALATGKQAIQ